MIEIPSSFFMRHQPLAAEFIGTFLLTFVVLLGLTAGFATPLPLLAGLTLGLMVYVVGPISGSHLNPAVTIGLFVVKKISGRDAGMYVVMQMFGAFCAAIVMMWMMGDAVIMLPVDSWMVGVGEAMGTAVLFIGVASVVYKKVELAASGLTIGTALALGGHVAAISSHAVINPAVAFGVGSFSWAYVLGPIIGAIIAAYFYQWLALKK